jgi:hypothetical protein
MSSPQGRPFRLLHLILVQVSAAAFAGGLILPLFTIEPRLDEWTGLARILAPDQMRAQAVTLLGGIHSMWMEGEAGLAALLAFFSILLPTMKLCLLSLEAASPGSFRGPWHRFTKMAARYAMLEVFVVALLVILAKGLPGGSTIELGPGTVAFTVSVLLGLVAGLVEQGRKKSESRA